MGRCKRNIITAMVSCGIFIWNGCNADSTATDNALTPTAKAPPAFDGTIAAVGDSLTAGFGVDEASAYPARLERKLHDGGYHYRVINAGVSGETSSGARSRIEWVITSLKPDIVILETGANDGLRGIDPRVLETNLDHICTVLKQNNIQILLAGMHMLPNLGPEYTRAFSTIYPKVAKQHQAVFMPFFLKEVAGNTQLNQPDRIHPTAQGYMRITENLYPYVLEVIERHRKGQAKH
jgi:acyl-CoA thioesterase-1